MRVRVRVAARVMARGVAAHRPLVEQGDVVGALLRGEARDEALVDLIRVRVRLRLG